MVKKIAFGIFATLLAVNTLFAGGGKIKWMDDYEEGVKKAKETGKAIMLYFHSDG